VTTFQTLSGSLGTVLSRGEGGWRFPGHGRQSLSFRQLYLTALMASHSGHK
jgi:hypothetical protein